MNDYSDYEGDRDYPEFEEWWAHNPDGSWNEFQELRAVLRTPDD